jgi:Holliday junction resolvase RusA-like endonuclease
MEVTETNWHFGVVIPIKPTAKQSVRIGPHGSYFPKETKKATKEIRKYVSDRYKGEPLDGPIMINVTFYIGERPKSAKKRMHPHTKPDLDNYMKLLGDALEGVVWTNDSRIVVSHLRKAYGTSQISILVRELDHDL